MLLTHAPPRHSQMGRISHPWSQMERPSLAPWKMSNSSSPLSVGKGRGERSPVVSIPSFLQVEVEFWEPRRPLSCHPGSQLWRWAPSTLALGDFQSGSEFPNALLFYWALFMCLEQGPSMCGWGVPYQCHHPPCHADQTSEIMRRKQNVQLTQPSVRLSTKPRLPS